MQGNDTAPALLNVQGAAKVLGVSERTFQTLRNQPWMPKPIVLGPRLLRWSRVELEAAYAAMPRTHKLPEVQSLAAGRRARIERMKSGASA